MSALHTRTVAREKARRRPGSGNRRRTPPRTAEASPETTPARRIAARIGEVTGRLRVGVPGVAISAAGSGRGARAVRLGARVGVVFGLAWGALLGVQALHAYALSSPHFEVRHLVYSETPHLDHEAIRTRLGLVAGQNLLSIDLEDLQQKVTRDPWVATAEVTRELPDTLHVAVTEHRPRAVLLAGHPYLVNEEGHVFKRLARGERGQLPVVTGIDRKTLLERPDEARTRIARALELISLYQGKDRPRLGEVHLGEHGEVVLYTAELGTKLVLGRGDPVVELERYDALRAALRDDADRISVVHLDAAARDDADERVFVRFLGDASPGTEGLLAQATTPETLPDEQPSPLALNAARRRIPRSH